MPLTTLKVSNFVDDSVTIGKLSATGTAGSSTYLRGDNTWTALSGLTGLYSASTNTSYAVTVAASKFVIDGVSQATISLVEGYTAVFDVSDSSVSTHILRFATAADAAGSTEYVSGVTAVGTPGSAGAKVFFTVPVGAPGLFYYCTAHSSMGGTANTTTATTKTAGDMWIDGGVTYLATDPNNAGLGVWVTSGNTTLARRYAASCGSQTANLGVGGLGSPGISNVADEFNGTGWAATTVFPSTARHWTMCGSQSAALTVSGELASSNSAVSYEFDGTSWTAAGSISSARTSAGSAGTQTAAVCWCGVGGVGSNLSEEYNGSSWSSTGNYIVSSYDSQGGGIQTAAWGNGGMVPPSTVSNTGEYNGTVWASGSNANYSVAEASAGGSQTAGLRASGYTSSPSQATNTSEEYDGTSWTTSRNLNTTRRTANTGAGSSAAGICANGYISDFSSVTELYEKTITQFPVA